MGDPKWNDISFDSNASAEEKAQEFDLQFAENQSEQVDNNPYSEENFPEAQDPDRRK